MAKRKKLASPQISPLKESLNRLLALLPEHEQALLLDELKKPLPSAIRFNPLKVDIYRLAKWCQEYGWQIEPVPFCPSGFQITSAHVALGQTVDQALGNYFIQDAASMLPVELFSFNDNEKPLILDLPASPGGKTSHLIANSLDQGFVIANDSSQQRIQALKIVLQPGAGSTRRSRIFQARNLEPGSPRSSTRSSWMLPAAWKGCGQRRRTPCVQFPAASDLLLPTGRLHCSKALYKR